MSLFLHSGKVAMNVLDELKEIESKLPELPISVFLPQKWKDSWTSLKPLQKLILIKLFGDKQTRALVNPLVAGKSVSWRTMLFLVWDNKEESQELDAKFAYRNRLAEGTKRKATKYTKVQQNTTPVQPEQNIKPMIYIVD